MWFNWFWSFSRAFIKQYHVRARLRHVCLGVSCTASCFALAVSLLYCIVNFDYLFTQQVGEIRVHTCIGIMIFYIYIIILHVSLLHGCIKINFEPRPFLQNYFDLFCRYPTTTTIKAAKYTQVSLNIVWNWNASLCILYVRVSRGNVLGGRWRFCPGLIIETNDSFWCLLITESILLPMCMSLVQALPHYVDQCQQLHDTEIFTFVYAPYTIVAICIANMGVLFSNVFIFLLVKKSWKAHIRQCRPALLAATISKNQSLISFQTPSHFMFFESHSLPIPLHVKFLNLTFFKSLKL